MKKASYFIIAVVLLGSSVVGFWIYQKYFKAKDEKLLFFEVQRGDIQEIVKARGEVVPQKEFNLEFPFSGAVEQVFVKDGQSVKAGDALMRLDTRDFEIEKDRLAAILSQKKAALDKLIAGATTEEIRVSEIKVDNANRAREDAEKALSDAIQIAFTYSDDAVRNKADQFFDNPSGFTPKLSFTYWNSQVQTDLESSRITIGSTLSNFKTLSDQTDSVAERVATARQYISAVKTFLNKASFAVNSLTANASISQTTIDGWKTTVATARTNVNTGDTAVVAAEEKLRAAYSAFHLAESELALKKSPARDEDMLIARAQIQENESQIAAIDEKIRKSTMRSPVPAKVLKTYLERNEIFTTGKTAVSLSASGYKIQSDISELDIGKVRDVNGNSVLIRFDAFPGEDFKGKVVFIQPKEIIKDSDVYFRTEMFLDTPNEMIRAGMSSDVVIMLGFKKDVVKVQDIAVYKKDEKMFVKVLPKGAESLSGNLKEIQVETGISDGEFIEIVKGVDVGETVVVSSD